MTITLPLSLGRLDAWPTVFSTGNVATGKGNIVASRKHAHAVAETVAEAFLGLGDADHAGEEALSEAAHAAIREKAEEIHAEIQRRPPLSSDAIASVRARVRERQEAVGYPGDYAAWIARVTPPDLE